MKLLLRIIWLILFLSSCRQVIELEINENDQLIVVEASLEATDSIHQVKITRTVGFSSLTVSPAVTDAVLALHSSDSEVFPFEHTSDGNYISEVVELKASTSYQLEIQLANGNMLESQTEFVNMPAIIDSVHYEQIEITDPQNSRDELIRYFPIVYGEDRPETRDFYVWKVYRNDTLFDQAQELILIEDRFFNGKDFRNDFTNFLFDINDDLTLEVQTVSENAYSYLEQFKEHQLNQQNNQPSNPNRLIGNISNVSIPNEVVLGNFSISNSKYFRKKIE